MEDSGIQEQPKGMLKDLKRGGMITRNKQLETALRPMWVALELH